jgi:hypothetical protein
MRAATRPNAIGAVQNVLRVDRFPQHRHRSLDDLLLAGGLADGALTPVRRLDPDALDGRGLVVSAAQTRMQVPQVLVQVFGVRRRCHPVNPGGPRLTRVAGGHPPHRCIETVDQGRANPRRIAGPRCRPAQTGGWDGW